jgi:hypothetical protein
MHYASFDSNGLALARRAREAIYASSLPLSADQPLTAFTTTTPQTNNGRQTDSILGQHLWQPGRRWSAGCDRAFARPEGAGRFHHGVHN